LFLLESSFPLSALVWISSCSIFLGFMLFLIPSRQAPFFLVSFFSQAVITCPLVVYSG
jgi:hypothetical protein